MKQLGPEQVCRRFSAEDPPHLRVESGEVFSVRTTDRFRNVSKTDPDFAKSDVVRSMNGPVYINGVHAGDTLKVEFLSMSPAETSGYVLAIPGHGALGSRIPNFLLETVDVTGKDAVFPNGTSVPIRPMLGLIGVAPEQGEAGTECNRAFRRPAQHHRRHGRLNPQLTRVPRRRILVYGRFSSRYGRR